MGACQERNGICVINRTVIQARLTADPVLRTTQSGVSVCSFRIAWSEKYKDNETKLFLQCTAWRGVGEFISKYFTKGQEIAVEGKLSTRDWTDNDGNKRSQVEMTVDNVSFCGPKRDNTGSRSQDVPPPPDDTGLFGDRDFEPLDDEQMPF
jgi:single-strand DNA-binding protein